MMLLVNVANLLAALLDGDVVLLSRLPREVFAGCVLLLAAIVRLVYRKVAAKLSPAMRWTLICLRLLFLAILLTILAVPAIEKQRSRSGKLFTAVLVDTSQSMSIGDVVSAGQTLTRF